MTGYVLLIAHALTSAAITFFPLLSTQVEENVTEFIAGATTSTQVLNSIVEFIKPYVEEVIPYIEEEIKKSSLVIKIIKRWK